MILRLQCLLVVKNNITLLLRYVFFAQSNPISIVLCYRDALIFYHNYRTNFPGCVWMTLRQTLAAYPACFLDAFSTCGRKTYRVLSLSKMNIHIRLVMTLIFTIFFNFARQQMFWKITFSQFYLLLFNSFVILPHSTVTYQSCLLWVHFVICLTCECILLFSTQQLDLESSDFKFSLLI